ncbi:class I SAM-dependent methyltransferase [Haloprofundus salinisoli]|uniref:class I SAM-dependent methyltransferase n=1 Tax=Haloprofundus salinisoli TaxID=2876193 RepID=UPI001CCDBAA0|nr:methyltransferase domain-containing protein [Haloprofundus salinisoli]
MRRFSAEYLERTRDGMWGGSREALSDLDLPNRRRILDVGCGTGELARVLAEEAPDAQVAGVDADPTLLRVAREQTGISVVAGDATRLPVADEAADLVVCQALLSNLPDPSAVVAEFARVSSELVAAVEPDNASVGVDSTVDPEVTLERSVREAYLDGVRTDVSLGSRVSELFADAGLSDVRTRRHHQRKVVEPPYDEGDVESARLKATGEGLDRYETELRRALSNAEFDALRAEWREMGRSVVDQMRQQEYRRAEVVPFDVTVGRV